MSVEQIVDKITDELRNRHLFAVFDRDGTLVPINPNPKEAILHDDVRKLLIELNTQPNSQVAILSARDLRELGDDFKEVALILSGNYGMELLIPNYKQWTHPDALQSRNLLLKTKEDLEKELLDVTGIILEDHELILCLHWHLTKSEHREKVHNCIQKLRNKYSSLLFKTLPTSYEVWPAIKWDKSNGLQKITAMLNVESNKDLILYVGDSDSDEPAFAWVNKQQGISVRVGQNSISNAQFEIESPKEVEIILKMLIVKMREY